ncbi:MAG: TraM recognition domain-containing protein [Chitinophagales bacterium]|nr:TraM recognition domain-containing protein [Chitinophagales bacterium]
MPEITPIGITNFRNQHQEFGIKDQDRLGHIYCVGKTGSGKSTLLLNMAISDIERGNGLGVIDPHGDLAEELLNYIPKERKQDVVYFNAGDTEYPISFNPLSNVKEQDRYLITATIVTTLKKLWSDSWGPRLEHILRNTLLSLSYYSKSTLLDIVPMLTDYEFRKKVLYAVPVYSILDFWHKEFEPLSPQLKNEFISPILNKVGLFTANPTIRNILGQQVSTIDIASIMDTKKIFIANLSKGVLGEAGTQLLGSLLVTQFQTTSLGRATRPIHTRVPFYLYIDEVHSFITKSFTDILSESRKYGLSIFLTHQFLDQLPEDIHKSIIGNVGTLISFRVGARDAKVLEEEFYPVFNQSDLINLPRFHIYLKLLIDGTTSKPFSGTTLLFQKGNMSYKRDIIHHSRDKYGTHKNDIEKVQHNRMGESAKGDNATLF